MKLPGTASKPGGTPGLMGSDHWSWQWEGLGKDGASAGAHPVSPGFLVLQPDPHTMSPMRTQKTCTAPKQPQAGRILQELAAGSAKKEFLVHTPYQPFAAHSPLGFTL